MSPVKAEEKTGFALLKDLMLRKKQGLLPEKKEEPLMTSTIESIMSKTSKKEVRFHTLTTETRANTNNSFMNNSISIFGKQEMNEDFLEKRRKKAKSRRYSLLRAI